MTRRPAVTLIEVLVTLFIMAIGMLALLTLFPIGALSMAQALKDDRCASTAAMAENVAIAMNIRHDSSVTGAFATSSMVYVDPNGAIQGLPFLGGVIPRVSPSFVTTPALADRWFSLPDDITFLANGTPDTINTGGFVDRGRRYSYTYLLRQMPPTSLVQLYVVVYSGRPVNSLLPTGETTVSATGGAGSNSIVVNATGTSLKRGGWILDPINGYFYRVTNLADTGSTTVVDVQSNLIANVTQVTIMDNVVEVFDKGTSWQP